MINLADCIEIGQFTRPHGYKGILILKLNSLNFDEIMDMEWVFVVIDGLPVPFFIEEFSERNTDTLLVKIENISSIEQTQELLNTSVYILRTIVNADASSKHSMTTAIGYTIIDIAHGPIGQLDSIIENPQNPLLCIRKNRQEILLPLQEEFILGINDESKEISVACPDGLLEISE